MAAPDPDPKPRTLSPARPIITCPEMEPVRLRLMSDEAFEASASFREQAFHACRILRDESRPPLPYATIGSLWGVSGGTIKDHSICFAARQNQKLKVGRPPLLSNAQLDQIVCEVIESFRRRKPMTAAEIEDLIERRFDIRVENNTLHHILARDERVKSCHGVPMEQPRLEVTPEQIEKHFADMCRDISGCPAHFLFNFDEMGHQDWSDAHDTVCFVPAEFEGDLVYYPVSRAGKRITLLGCIAADGSYVRPGVIISRKTTDDEILELGLTPEKVEFYSQDNAFIETAIFNDWIRDSFVPEVVRRRQQWQYNGPGILMLDNCTSHAGDEFEALLRGCQIKPFFLPPHASNQLQPLDLSIFGVTKSVMRKINSRESINVQSDHLNRVLNSFWSAAVPNNIVKSFRNAGLALIYDPESIIRVAFVPRRARCLMDYSFTRYDPDPSALEEEEEVSDCTADEYRQECKDLLFGAHEYSTDSDDAEFVPMV